MSQGYHPIFYLELLYPDPVGKGDGDYECPHHLMDEMKG